MDTPENSPHRANRLIHETSPYLLQHAHNPVDWYPWGPEALDRARREDRLIQLSIGYSACHWCHVMERESFENDSIAELMNQHFVNIKVDREERPDLDEIYMAATLAMNRGQGGWPMTVFLTPEGEPLFAGTYFPPSDSHGRPGFPTLLKQIAGGWEENRAEFRAQAKTVLEHLRGITNLGPRVAVTADVLETCVDAYASVFDGQFGGFGPAPKFPQATGLSLLLRIHRRFGDERALDMVEKTLEAMAYGGLYDQVGGGFARYATDRRWLIPHFEKMLYDNALLTRAYLEAYQVTGRDLYARVARETLDYVLREMTSDGGFYSSTDADSEGEEGKFFVWRPDEIVALLGEETGRWFNTFYDITPEGNWEGKNILNCPRSVGEVAEELGVDVQALEAALAAARERVYQARLTRVPPSLDDKILTAWNGLMIGAFAEGFRVLGDERYLDAARTGAEFVLQFLTTPNGRLLRTHRAGKSHLDAYLEDYAYLSEGLIDLYEAGGHVRYLREAERLLLLMLVLFSDEESGAFFNTASDHETLVLRYREGSDGATPSANATAASALARMSYHLDRTDLREAAIRSLQAYGAPIAKYPRGYAKSLTVADFLLEGPVEIALVGVPGSEDHEALRRVIAAHYLPNRIQAWRDPRADDDAKLPLLEGKGAVGGKAALYVCRDFSCQTPVSDEEGAHRVLRSARGNLAEAGAGSRREQG